MAIFADAAHYVALMLRSDNLHDKAHRLARENTNESIVTCEPVLVEVLAHMSRLGERTRAEAVGLVEDLRQDSLVTIVAQTPELFEDGLALYRARLDKQYSLTDCMSMTICSRLGIEEVLTHDHHFAQEGLTILL